METSQLDLVTTKYSYPRGAATALRIGAAAILLMLAAATVVLVDGVATRALDICRALAVSAVVLGLSLWGATGCNVHPSIHVNDYGLGVEVFIFWRRWIPWQDVVGIVPLAPSQWGSEWLVLVRRLTPIHRFMGLLHGRPKLAAFQIALEMDEVFSLMQTIQEQLAASRDQLGLSGNSRHEP